MCQLIGHLQDLDEAETRAQELVAEVDEANKLALAHKRAARYDVYVTLTGMCQL